jgi:hypothetical protein
MTAEGEEEQVTPVHTGGAQGSVSYDQPAAPSTESEPPSAWKSCCMAVVPAEGDCGGG